MCLLAAACIPARTPENLRNTPGAPAVITDEEYTGTAFRVRYPAGWRVIKGAAIDRESVTFSGEECQLIYIYVSDMITDAAALSDCDTVQMTTQSVRLGNHQINVMGAAPESIWDAFEAVFSRVVQSVQAP